jgi:hypothetical protein
MSAGERFDVIDLGSDLPFQGSVESQRQGVALDDPFPGFGIRARKMQPCIREQ